MAKRKTEIEDGIRSPSQCFVQNEWLWLQKLCPISAYKIVHNISYNII